MEKVQDAYELLLSGYVGDIKEGRGNLGGEVPVAVYRLLEYTMREVLIENLGEEECIRLFREAGKRAGIKFAEQLLDLDAEKEVFLAQLQECMKLLKMGIFRIEEMDDEVKHMVIAISEDLDCSGLPVTGQTVCNYDEGFIAGVLNAYTYQEYDVIESDCWANGGRVCRFKANKRPE